MFSCCSLSRNPNEHLETDDVTNSDSQLDLDMLPDAPPFEEVLSDPRLLESFRQYASQTMCLDYLECYIQLERMTTNWDSLSKRELVEEAFKIYGTYASNSAETSITLQKGSWKAVKSLFQYEGTPPEDADKKSWLSPAPINTVNSHLSEVVDPNSKEAMIEAALAKDTMDRPDFARLTSTLKSMLTSMCYFGYAASPQFRDACRAE
eukprot:CAMPEP_0177629680 /NCGR_PEP_ID=MMETSP0447-20121125/799_1 /TAXON_ID=0 /ORGANISM="Stygamoeba regulata, Strain BSH-02190019" /LENGTH=206 /DNA_ID=CAMNT_0019131021 /DNA_START=190 /DNA_END=807 /DNA_ORIENTATION=-